LRRVKLGPELYWKSKCKVWILVVDSRKLSQGEMLLSIISRKQPETVRRREVSTSSWR